MYISDNWHQCIRKVTVATGIITTIAGTGTSSYSGDGGLATSATFNYPRGIVLDSAGNSLIIYLFPYSFDNFLLPFHHLGNVYIADYNNNRIRKVTVSTGIITTFAGTGSPSYSGDNGQATSASLNYPVGVALDASGTHSSLLFWQLIFFYLLSYCIPPN